MKLTFLGANHEVTGSCTMLEAAGSRAKMCTRTSPCP